MNEAPRSILLVCMGNICRSPSAEGVLRARLDAAGLGKQVQVDSAGTHGYHAGEAPDPRAVRHAAARGYDLARLRARKVEREDFSRFDWILAMDEDNLARLRQIAPDDAHADLGLLMDHALRHAGVREVPDPYYGSAAGFERVLDLVEDACDGIVARLLRAQSL
ncbi:low molecular weight protein-tyrosine-phosphatase [Rubrivivax gelatinosus]|uniref:protein-tyrosine-phosphatase n=1 Tax=Rubrivivax gelatinosus TaxID=28068 RepID=A0A4R2M5C6_RUBGE|nr:low molecular weight protein-tyrosine-phosphatase [Rubrivivax gelatinosus]MBK1686898.1 phosphotyrosine protein phosphatase [Rubrivivax gelatinosus]TCP01400.1 protein tyrosine phosphatase [Rubrivivax gelatinosus]